MDEEKKTGICRVCLSTVKKKSMSLFQTYKNYLVFDHINAIANIQIREDDGLPDRICPTCLLDLETAINFKQKCESSNIILQTSTLTEANADIEIEAKHLIVKKEEPQEEELEFLDADSQFFDSDLFDVGDKNSAKALNKVELGLRPSRAIDLRLQCHDCGSFFKSKCKLRVHWKEVHIKQGLFCTSCRRQFKSYKAYNKHQINKRKSCMAASNFRIEGTGKSRIFYCKECEYKSFRIKDMITHWVIHTGDRPYKCDLCPTTCTQQSSLQAHRESAHKEYRVEITCHFCGKLIKGRSRIYRHLRIHTDKGLQCQICTKTLKNKNSLAQHMQRHSGVKSYTCEKCAKFFYTSAELSNHKRTVHNKGSIWYHCDLCDYKAVKKDVIKRHKAKHSDTNKPCTVCGMFFECANKLILHQRRHFEEKKHACPHCDTRFFRKDSVTKHMRSKHPCTVVLSDRPAAVKVKEEISIVNKHYDDVIEIEMSPPNVS